MSSPAISTAKAAAKQLLSLREIEAGAGWTGAVLEIEFPAPPSLRQTYAAAATELQLRLPPFERVTAPETFLQFDRCAPDREIPIIQENARSWQPEIGLGVWLDREPPTLWSKEEFLAAAPGTLRPVINRALRIQPDPAVQAAAWTRLLGSGTLVRVAPAEPPRWLEDTTEYLRPRVTEPSLASFPFNLPLVTEAALRQPNPTFPGGPEAWLPGVDGYLRESAEDGGLLILARLAPEIFWSLLNDTRLGLEPMRLKP